MILKKRVEAFAELGNLLASNPADLAEIIHTTELYNPWFTKFHCELMLRSICESFLQTNKLETWLAPYGDLPEKNKTVGLILAGNIPFVGMHDILCSLLSGCSLKIKLSSKDTYFFPYLLTQLVAINNAFSDKIQFVDKLENFDAVIATGSNNTSKYFDYYFGKYANIIRKNRTSIAILSGNETLNELYELGKDVFYYYGLGCRNVGKIFIPQHYNITQLLDAWKSFDYVIDNTKYKNNFDYNLTLLLMNQTPHISNEFIMLVEKESVFSPLASLHYEYYKDENDLQEKLNALENNLQCVVAGTSGNTYFGKTQFPELWHYADGIDTIDFLKSL